MSEVSAGGLSAFAQSFELTVSCLIEMEAMKAANEKRRRDGMADAYGPDEFFDVQGKLDTTGRNMREWIR